MFKKVTGILLALAMVLSLAACTGSTGTDETAGSQDSAANQTTNQTEGTAFQPEKNLSQLVAERNPKDRMEEVTIALEIAREELGRAVAAVEKAGLSGDETLQEELGYWDDQLTSRSDYVKKMDGEMTQELDEELVGILMDGALGVQLSQRHRPGSGPLAGAVQADLQSPDRDLGFRRLPRDHRNRRRLAPGLLLLGSDAGHGTGGRAPVHAHRGGIRL